MVKGLGDWCGICQGARIAAVNAAYELERRKRHDVELLVRMRWKRPICALCCNVRFTGLCDKPGCRVMSMENLPPEMQAAIRRDQ